jgi:hypothetical protein
VTAGVAQLVEHLICNQRVGGSNPFASSKAEIVMCRCGAQSGESCAGPGKEVYNFCCTLTVAPVGSQAEQTGKDLVSTRDEPAADERAPNARGVGKSFGQVAERSMAAGCKPAAPCELRGFESSPVHQLREVKSTHRSVYGRWVPSRSRMLRGGSNSVVESQPSKLLVAGSIPVSRSKSCEGQRLNCPIW